MGGPLSRGPDLDLRLVRYFTVLARHQHFGRAAAELHLTQPSLSRQIRQLEKRLGARLVDRAASGSRLTRAGKDFLPQAHALLQLATEAAASARAASEPGRITIGHNSNLFITAAVRALRREHPDAEIDTIYLSWLEAPQALLEHRVDAAVARPPFPTDHLSVTVLYEEPRVLLVPVNHRLARRTSVTMDEIGDEPMPMFADAECNAFWRVDPRPDGSRAPGGPLVDSVEGNGEIIAGGQAIAIVPAAVRAGALRPDLTTIDIHDINAGQVVLVTRRGDKNPMVDAFAKCARQHLTGTSTE